MREARLVKLPRVPSSVLFSINPSPRLPPIESNSKRRKIYASRYIYISFIILDKNSDNFSLTSHYEDVRRYLSTKYCARIEKRW